MAERLKSEEKGKTNFVYNLVRKAKEMFSFSKNSREKTYKEVNEENRKMPDDNQGFKKDLQDAALLGLLFHDNIFPYNDGGGIGIVPLIPPDQPSDVNEARVDDTGLAGGDAGCGGDGGGFGE